MWTPRFYNPTLRRLEVWNQRRKLTNTLRSLDARFDKDFSAAVGYEAQRAIDDQRRFECSEYEDQVQRIDSITLVTRARLCHIDISDVPDPPDRLTGHWTQGNHGTWFINPKSFRVFAKMVEEAEYQRAKRKLDLKDFWWKLITAVAAIAGAGAGIWNLLRRP